MFFQNLLGQIARMPPLYWVLLSAFGLCFLIQLYFLLFRFSKLSFFKRKERETTAALPVSVVVCAHNHLDKLQTLLGALTQQDYPDYEIIVVDDRSDDDMYDWLLMESRKPDSRFRLVRINYTPEHLNSKKYALTMGIKAARKPYLLLTDADCEPISTNWISHMAASFADGIDMVLGYSPYRTQPGFLNTLIRFDTFFTALQYLSFALAGKPYMGVGRNLAYRRSFFLNNKGFAGHYGLTGGDDDLLVNRLSTPANVALCLHPESQVVSEPKQDFTGYFRQKRRHLYAGKHYKWQDKLNLGLLTGSLIGFYILFGVMLFLPPLTFIVAVAFLVRLLILAIILGKAARTLNEKFGWLELPLLDMWLPIHYLIFGVPALISRRIEWN